MKKIGKADGLYSVISRTTRAPFVSVNGSAVCAHAFSEESLAEGFLVKQIANSHELVVQKADGRSILNSMVRHAKINKQAIFFVLFSGKMISAVSGYPCMKNERS